MNQKQFDELVKKATDQYDEKKAEVDHMIETLAGMMSKLDSMREELIDALIEAADEVDDDDCDDFYDEECERESECDLMCINNACGPLDVDDINHLVEVSVLYNSEADEFNDESVRVYIERGSDPDVAVGALAYALARAFKYTLEVDPGKQDYIDVNAMAEYLIYTLGNRTLDNKLYSMLTTMNKEDE